MNVFCELFELIDDPEGIDADEGGKQLQMSLVDVLFFDLACEIAN